jgi:VWFA-related protein
MLRIRIPLAALGLWGTTLLAAPSQTFTSRIDAVRVDVLVTASGQPVQGLRAADFEIRDNGVLQRPNLVSFEKTPLNLVLALDTSGSLSERNLEHLRRAADAVIAGLRPGDRAGLITFSHIVSQPAPLTDDFQQLRASLAELRAWGETSLVDASQAGMLLAERGEGRGLVVLFSDGVDTSSWLAGDLVLSTARRSEAVVYAVAVGRRADDFLEELTDLTGGRLLRAETTDTIRALFVQVLEEFRHRYLVSYSPQGVEPGGWHRLQVRVKARNATVRARPGYLAR